MNLYGRREGPHLQTPMTASQVRDHSTSGSVGEMKPATMPSGVWRDFFLMGAIARSQYLYTAAKPTQQAPTGKEKLADVYIYGARTRTRAHTRHNIRVHVHVSHTRLVRTYRYVCPCCARLISAGGSQIFAAHLTFPLRNVGGRAGLIRHVRHAIGGDGTPM